MIPAQQFANLCMCTPPYGADGKACQPVLFVLNTTHIRNLVAPVTASTLAWQLALGLAPSVGAEARRLVWMM
jgi:hypothetical protein